VSGWKFGIRSGLAISCSWEVEEIEQLTSGNRSSPKDHPIAHLRV
jgi:hypothetical protein